MQARWCKIGVFTGLYILAGTASGPVAAATPRSTYIWLFTSEAADTQKLAKMVTEEFEESLLKVGCLHVVERRELPRLLAHQEQEKRISNANSLDATSRRELATKSADSVIFGATIDDLEGGQFKVAVTLQTLAGEILATASVRVTRGKRFDAEERELRMGELASNLCSSLGFTKKPPLPPPPTVSTDFKSAQGFEFILERCAPEGSALDCWFNVTNKRERRVLRVYVDSSQLIDQNGNPHKMKFALGSGDDREYIELKLDLATDVNERFGLHFEGLGGYVTSLRLLDVKMRGMNSFNLEWRNVQVK